MTTRAPRIGIVVTDAYPADDPDHDTPLLLAALREHGADATAVVWHAGSDLTAHDLLVIRSPWDYPERTGEFLAWLAHAESVTAVINAPATMRWNLDKHYLRDLADAGIRVVPTTYCGTAEAARRALAAHGADRVVVKPAVSAGARDTGLFDAADPRAQQLAERIVAGGGVAMIQPEIAELSAGAEKAVYAIDGQHTHAIEKGALLDLGGGFVGGVYIERPVLVDATEAERAFAAEVIAAVTHVTGAPLPLYARVDMVDSAAYGLVLLEVELVEPALNLHVAPHAIGAVVTGIVRAAAGAAAAAVGAASAPATL